MNKQTTRKGVACYALALAASLMLAMAFTLNACGGDGGGGDDIPASSSSGGGSPSSSSQTSPKCGSVEYNPTEKLCDERDKKLYKYVEINGQTWMAENLNYSVSESKCYENNNANCAKYGRLYDWETAKKACPSDWRLPSIEDWEKLIYYVMDDKGCTDGCPSEHLKSVSDWNDNSSNGEDSYDFSALPGGAGYGDIFDYAGDRARLWSASTSERDDNDARFLQLDDGVSYGETNKDLLQSVRCIQD
ncbi:MAG: hypothetical protein LBH25_04190 [Fibromonadaceae bacterium]|jgi:uncharacterized protein (TIGR02145 family)|nr:hypothetical protein [Fibromonadaceae bacterium]